MKDMFEQKGIRPMLIAEQVAPYNDENSIFELKLDGIRCIAYCDKNGIDLRNKRDYCLLPRFPELNTLHQCCREKCILDGELNVLVNGKPDFYEVQKRTMLTDPFKIHLSLSRYPANFTAYDILYYRDHAVTDLPLMERKSLLAATVTENPLLGISRYIEKEGVRLFEVVKEQQLEGVVGKRMDSLYHIGKRTKDWKKIKWLKDDDYICIGYITKQNHMTSLILALLDDRHQYRIMGHVTLGVSPHSLKAYLTQAPCPLSNFPKGCSHAVWVNPFVCTVSYMPSDKEGMRQPVFKGVRDDKRIEECLII